MSVMLYRKKNKYGFLRQTMLNVYVVALVDEKNWQPNVVHKLAIFQPKDDISFWVL